MSPIEKKGDDGEENRVVKAIWGIVVILVGSVLLAFLLGIWAHYIVEFFMKGWELVR